MKSILTIGRRLTQLEKWVRDLQKGSSKPSSTTSSSDIGVANTSDSKYLLSKSGSTLSFDGAKINEVGYKGNLLMYKLPDGGLTSNIDAMTKAGAMASSTISLSDGFDKVIVGGSDQNSYIQFPFIFTHNRCRYKLRVRVDAIGATAPLLGFRNIWPGSTYSNYNNPQFYGYFNLSTGAATTTTAGMTLQNEYNGWLTPVGLGDIVELEIEYAYMQPRTFSIRKVSDTLTGEISSKTQLKQDGNIGDWAHIHKPAIIMADGTYTILEYSIESLDSQPTFLIAGDSIGTSVNIPYADSLVGKLNSKLPHRAACVAAGTSRMKGLLSALWQVPMLRPKYLIIFHYLDAIYPNYADPVNVNHATWLADFKRYVDTVKGLGIIPIIVYPETWATAILGGTTTVCGYYETVLNTEYPDDIKIKVMTSETFYDNTGFHYLGVTNEVVANKIIAALDTAL